MSPSDAFFASMRSSVRSRPAPLPIEPWNNPPRLIKSKPLPAHVLPTVRAAAPPEPDAFATSGEDRRRDNDPGTALLNEAIGRYASCTRRDRKAPCQCAACAAAGRKLGDAWRLLAPEARSTISGRVREVDRQDDAEQLAFLKTWQAVRNYNPERGPVKSGAAFVRWAADKTALNVVEKRDRVSSHEHGALDNDEMRDIVEYRADQFRGGAGGMDDAKAMADYARYASENAGTPDRGKLWAAIVLAVADGLVERRDIAEYVGSAVGREIPEVSIRREVWHMVRKLDVRAIDHLEVLIDWRTRDTVDDDTGQSALFDFDWQEIA